MGFLLYYLFNILYTITAVSALVMLPSGLTVPSVFPFTISSSVIVAIGSLAQSAIIALSKNVASEFFTCRSERPAWRYAFLV